MAADERFERGLSAALHGYLDPAAAPHPRWTGSPAQLAVAGDTAVARRPDRRVSRTAVLLAAAVAVAVLLAALVVVGARLGQPSPPIPPPQGLVVPPSEAPSRAPSVEPTPSTAVVRPSPSADTATLAECVTRWSHTGAYPPGGLMDGTFAWRIEGPEGSLHMDFLNAIDTVRQITIAPATPPFRGGHGKDMTIAGGAFFKLTIRGLTRATENTDDDMKATETKRGPGWTWVGPPIAEARRIRTPRQAYPKVVPQGDSTEVWIIGVDGPSCLEVTTYHDPTFEEVAQPGDNSISVAFVPAPTPIPAPTVSPSPAPSG
jgi:hypothetical protein